MTANILDNQTEEYFSRIANRVNYIYRDYTPRPITSILAEADKQPYTVGSAKMPDGETVAIYSFESDGSAEILPDSKPEQTPTQEQYFASDWPIHTGSGYDHITYIYDDRPNREDILKVRRLHKVQQKIEYGELNQYILNERTNKRIHWTDLTSPGGELPLTDRILMLKYQICDPRKIPEMREKEKQGENNLVYIENTTPNSMGMHSD